MGMREFQAQMRALQQIEKSAVDSAAQSATVQQHGTDYDVLCIALTNDVNKIRAFPSFELKAEYKRDVFLPKWMPFVEEYLEKGIVYQNDYLAYCIIYSFDVGDFDTALRLADLAIKQNQSLPDRFKSTLPTFVANQIYDWTDKTASAGYSVEPYFSQTLQNVATQWQLHETITAKWLKMAAALLLRNNQGKVHAASMDDPERLELAVKLCNRAFQLNPKSGVKSLIERCQMRLAKLHKDAGSDSPLEVGLSLETQEIDFSLIVEKLRADPLSEDKDGGANV